MYLSIYFSCRRTVESFFSIHESSEAVAGALFLHDRALLFYEPEIGCLPEHRVVLASKYRGRLFQNSKCPSLFWPCPMPPNKT
jgi:hypothetical protein